MPLSDWQNPQAQAELARMVTKAVFIDCGRCWAWEQAKLPVARQGWPPGASIDASIVQCITQTMMPTVRPTAEPAETPEPVDPFLQAFRNELGILK